MFAPSARARRRRRRRRRRRQSRRRRRRRPHTSCACPRERQDVIYNREPPRHQRTTRHTPTDRPTHRSPTGSFGRGGRAVWGVGLVRHDCFVGQSFVRLRGLARARLCLLCVCYAARLECVFVGLTRSAAWRGAARLCLWDVNKLSTRNQYD